MNRITELLDLEDSEIIVSDIQVKGTRKTLTLEMPPAIHFCPQCGLRMHSRGIKKRSVSHPILQDGYELIFLLKQRHTAKILRPFVSLQQCRVSAATLRRKYVMPA